jgi:hypothetical protein
MWEFICDKEKVKEKKDLYFDNELYVLCKSIMGDIYRSIPKLKRVSWNTILKVLDRVDPNDNIITIKEKLVSTLVGNAKDDLNKNVFCTDIEMQVDNLLELDKKILDDQIIDIEDANSLKLLNTKVFQQWPLNLNFLLESNKNVNPFQNI